MCLVKNQERGGIFITVVGTYPGVTGQNIQGREMNDERGILYLSFVLASIISDSDIYSDPRSHMTCLQSLHEKHYLNVVNVTYHN